MTGFGSSNFEDSNLSINVELKSFNSRYFELNTKSFELSGPLEYKIRNYLKKHLLRGSVTLFIKVDSKNSFKLNSQKTSSVLKAYKEIEKKYGKGVRPYFQFHQHSKRLQLFFYYLDYFLVDL